jgi:hypothetical protein
MPRITSIVGYAGYRDAATRLFGLSALTNQQNLNIFWYVETQYT